MLYLIISVIALRYFCGLRIKSFAVLFTIAAILVVALMQALLVMLIAG